MSDHEITYPRAGFFRMMAGPVAAIALRCDNMHTFHEGDTLFIRETEDTPEDKPFISNHAPFTGRALIKRVTAVGFLVSENRVTLSLANDANIG